MSLIGPCGVWKREKGRCGKVDARKLGRGKVNESPAEILSAAKLDSIHQFPSPLHTRDESGVTWVSNPKSPAFPRRLAFKVSAFPVPPNSSKKALPPTLQIFAFPHLLPLGVGDDDLSLSEKLGTKESDR